MATIKTKGMIQASASQSALAAGVDTVGAVTLSDVFTFNAAGNGNVTLTCSASRFALASILDSTQGNISAEGHGHVTFKRGAKSYAHSGDLSALDLVALVAALRTGAEAAAAGIGGMDPASSYGLVDDTAQVFEIKLSGNVVSFNFICDVEQNQPSL